MQYYSQHGEDKIFISKYASSLSENEKNYIEIGALDGVRYSNTKALEQYCGWTGILVEPNPTSFNALKQNRPGNVLRNDLVGNEPGIVEFRYFENLNLAAVSGIPGSHTQALKNRYFSDRTADSWLQEQQRTNLRTIHLDQVPLSQIIFESRIQEFGFFSLDVEGHEFSVLSSHDWKYRIRFIYVEDNGDDRVADLLKEKNYKHMLRVANNDLYELQV